MKDNKTSNVKIVFALGLIFELFLVFPILSWFTAVFLTGGSLYVAEFVISVIAIVVVSASGRGSLVAPIIGIFASLLGAVPILGWFMHLVAAVAYLMSILNLSVTDKEKTDTQELKKITKKEKKSETDDNIKDAEIVE